MTYGETLTPVEGDAGVVTTRSQEFLTTAAAILAAASELVTVTDSQQTVSVAVDEVRSLAEQVHDEILLAHDRYQAAALALSDFAPVLASAQQRANAAYDAYYPQVSVAREAYDDFMYHAGDAEGRETARQQWQVAESRASATREEYYAAVADLRAASDAAADRIRVVVDQSELNDSLWDNLVGAGDQIGQWFADVFGPMIDVLLDVLARVVQVLAVIVSVVLLLAVAVVVGLDALAYLMTGDEGFKNEAIALVVGAISPMLLSAWLTGRGTPSVENAGRFAPKTRVPGTGRDDVFGDAIRDQARIDSAGDAGVLGADSAVIQVSTVVGEDGITRYRVQIPSTQQWFSAGGDAPNDLDGNLWAKFYPDQRSELEKAVELALLEAGYIPGSGSDIMLSGFSQGGIAAANLAADPAFTRRFDVTSVFTVGSPIGDVPIPANVSVMAIEHVDDVVPHLDFFTDNPSRDNWITISTAPANPNPEALGHNTEDYAASAVREIDRSTDPRIVEYRESQQQFFYGTETVEQFEARRG
jgi:dienelactone hydrolase